MKVCIYLLQLHLCDRKTVRPRYQEKSLMNKRRFIVFIICILFSQLAAGCSMWDRKNKDLPEARRVKVIVFPVRWLSVESVNCRQEYEDLELSGTLKNVSPIPLLNVRVRVDVFLANETKERFVVSIPESPLEPAFSSEFKLSTTVDQPVSHVELHSIWKTSP